MHDDQINYAKRVSLVNGSQEIREVFAPRQGATEQRAEALWPSLIKALTSPLTEKEKVKGRYDPAPPPRTIFEGTLLDAQAFFQQSMPVAACGDCPIAKYTDGLPINIPTEDAVREMLTGTSHSPDEVVYSYTKDATTGQYVKGTTPVNFNGYLATVEKVAVNAVMSGCKPEYLPVVLAISTSGCGIGTDPVWSSWEIVSGPYAKEIGMNSQVGAMNPQNVANRPIGRTYSMMTTTLRQTYVGVDWMNAFGHPANNGACFAEYDEGLPEGWLTLREECGMKKTESGVFVTNTITNIFVQDTLYGSFYRGFQERAPDTEWPQGSPARRLLEEQGINIIGKPGPHNFLAVGVHEWWDQTWGSRGLIFIPRIAKDLHDAGFATKEALNQWIWKESFVTYHERALLGVRGVVGPTDSYTNKAWADIPADLPYPRNGSRANNLILVSGGTYEEWMRLDIGRPSTLRSIDVWR